MTEQEWLAGDNWQGMVDFFWKNPPSQRKARLFGCAAARRVWARLQSERARAAIALAERFADTQRLESRADVVEHLDRLLRGRPHGDSLWLAERFADQLFIRAEMEEVYSCLQHSSLPPLDVLAIDVTGSGCDGGTLLNVSHLLIEEQSALPSGVVCSYLRDLFGNPFLPVALDPAWRTPAALRLAEVAYGERELPSGHLDAAHLAVLADALEEAGCESTDLLGHLRSPGPHVRGCWALDLILGKD